MITPKDYVGALIQLSESRRGEFVDMQFLTEARTTLTYNIPLAEVIHPAQMLWFSGPRSGVCLQSKCKAPDVAAWCSCMLYCPSGHATGRPGAASCSRAAAVACN